MEEKVKVGTESNETTDTTSKVVQEEKSPVDNRDSVIIGLKAQLKRSKAESANLKKGVATLEEEIPSGTEGETPDWADTEKKYRKALSEVTRKSATLAEELSTAKRNEYINAVCSKLGAPREIFDEVTSDRDIIDKIIEWREDTKSEDKDNPNEGKFEKGGGTQSAVTAEKIKSMSSEDFAKFTRQLSDEARRR